MSNNAPATLAPETETPRPASRLRKVLRVLFRACRTTLVLLIFLIAAAAIYFNQAGLPERVKERLTANLRAKGWEIQYSKVRLSLRRAGIIVDNLYLHRTNMWSGPQIYVQKAQCTLRRSDLKGLTFKVNSAKLEGGRVLWAMDRTNRLQSTFVLNNVAGELLFRTNDLWELKGLTGTLLGLQLNVSGVVSNGSLIRDWRFPARAKAPPPAELYGRWGRILSFADQVRLPRSPQLTAQFTGDANDLEALQCSVLLYLPEFASPWAEGTNLLLSATSQRLSKSGQRGLEVDCLIEAAQSRWAGGKAVHVQSSVRYNFTAWSLASNLVLRIEAEEADSPWAAAHRLSGTSTIHLPT